jgi:Cytidylate kinase
MRITISGLPGSGTTSLTYHLAEIHRYDVISAGEVFRQMAKERGLSLGGVLERSVRKIHRWTN